MMEHPEYEDEAPDLEELRDSSIGAESPGLYPSLSVVAGNGLFAILGHDLSLLRLYKVGSESAKCIQGYHPKLDPNPSSPERMRQLFWQGQSDTNGVFDWGLRLKLNEKIVRPGLITKHGFVDSRWPSQKIRDNNPDSRIYQKATTYVRNGRLIQVMAIACNTPSDFSWEIGGEVQMWSEADMQLQLPDVRYTVKLSSSQSGNRIVPVLSVEGEFVEDTMCMDAAVFLNREPQSFADSNISPTAQSANFTRGCIKPISLSSGKGQCVVAIFSLRDKRQIFKPQAPNCPSWAELRGRLGIKKLGQEDIYQSGKPLLNLNAALVEKTGISQLAVMPDIITRMVEQLCSIAIFFKIEADDSDYSDSDSLFSGEIVDGPDQAGVMHDHEAQGQSLVSIANNFSIEPLLGQFIQEPYFWHIRLLAQVLAIVTPEKGQEKPDEDVGIVKEMKDIISGSISRSLSLIVPDRLVAPNFVSNIDLRKEVIEIQAFLVMSLLSARSCVDLETLPQAKMIGWILPIQVETVPGDESFDAVLRLLQWCHRKILMNKKFQALFSGRDWLQKYLDTESDRLNLELERYRDGALRPLSMPSEIDILSGSDDAADVFSQLDREEQWMRLALLQVEIFDDDVLLRPFLSKLVDQVSKRLKRRASAFVGYLPPWGYRCLDHLLEMDWAVAKKKLGYSWEDLQNKVQSSYENCLYFLKSDLSFFKSRDPADPSWIRGHWDMDFSSAICSSFLEAARLLQQEPGSAHGSVSMLDSLGHIDLGTMSLMMSSLEAAHDVLHPLQQSSGFPWKQNLPEHAHHPQFMCTSLRIRDGERDGKRLEERIEALKNQDKSNALVSDIFKDLVSSAPKVWAQSDLDVEDGEVRIVDFPSRRQSHLKNDVVDLLVDNRVDSGATYRIIAVNTLERPGLVSTYLHFAHEDAWEAVVDYFGSSSLFRGFTDTLHEDTKELSWRMSINITHIILQPPIIKGASDHRANAWEPPKHDIPEEYDPDKRAFREVCSAICSSGDRLGEFWTCSFLGPFSKVEKSPNKTNRPPAQEGGELQGQGQQKIQTSKTVLGVDKAHKPAPVFDADKITKINERYRFDKYSARNLVFVVQLTRLIWILSGFYEDVAEYLESIMKLYDSEALYGKIASPEFTKSGTKTATDVTDTLRRVLWGIEWLQKLEWSIKSAEIAINEAINYVERNVSKRRQYWHPKLKDYEQEQIWGKNRRALSQMKACQNRVETIDRRATGIKDNLISLTNMSSTKAILTTTADTSRMKIISILTAVFLPFTVVAVVLTIPMFEWPKAAEGEIIVSLPFKIFWETSIPLGALTGLLMWLISEGEKRGWKNLPLFLAWRRAFGHQPGNDALGSGSSEVPSNPKTPSSNTHGGVGAALPLQTPTRAPVGKDKTSPTRSRGAMHRWFRRSRSPNRKHTTDVEKAPVSPHQEQLVEFLGK